MFHAIFKLKFDDGRIVEVKHITMFLEQNFPAIWDYMVEVHCGDRNDCELSFDRVENPSGEVLGVRSDDGTACIDCEDDSCWFPIFY